MEPVTRAAGSRACPVCAWHDSREMYRFEPARWIPGRVVRCVRCRAVFKVVTGDKPPAAFYDESYADSEYWSEDEATLRALGRIRDEVVEHAKADGASLLDVGCGAGSFLGLAGKAGFRVTGLELNATLAEMARKRTGAEVIEGDFLAAPLEGRQFDVVTLLDLIEHVPDPVTALRRCAAMLRPGGRVVLYTPNHSGVICRVADALYRATRGRMSGPVEEIFDCTHLVFFDRESLSRAVAAADLEVERSVMIKYDPSRSNQAKGVSATALRGLEALSPLVNGEFRILMFARKRCTGEHP